MAAQLNIVANLATETDVPNHLRVQVIVRRGEVVVSRGGHVLEQRAGVLAVEQPQARNWLIRFDDGTTWAAQMPEKKKGGCGCR